MASILFDRKSKHFFVRFRYGGRSFKRSLGTGKEKLARAQAARVEETILLLRNGRLTMPANSDPAAYILSDGRVFHDGESKLLTLAELTAAFQARRIPGHKEANTIKTEDIHIRHLVRILKGNTIAQAIGYTHVQGYVAKRLGELVHRVTPLLGVIPHSFPGLPVRCLRAIERLQTFSTWRHDHEKRSCTETDGTR